MTPTPASPLSKFLALYLTLFLAVMTGACSFEPDQVVVDFSKTVPSSQPRSGSGGNAPLKGAVAAMISPRETYLLYRQLLAYLAKKSGQDLEFVQRKTYQEINQLLGTGELDVAFICSGPYALAKERFGFVPLAVPQVKKSTTYRAYLIVSRTSPYQKLEDLRGQTFAFTDPDSNTGRLVPTFWLAELREQPEDFFRQIIYTYSHDHSILAVARGLVAAATVDGLVWDYYQTTNPAFTSRTRIIRKSEPYGIPPLVASRHLSATARQRLQQTLLNMHQDPEGRAILAALLIDRFTLLKEEWYEPIRALHRRVALSRNLRHVSQPQK